VSINNVGSDRTVITDVYLTGDTDFAFANEGPPELPWELPGVTDCGIGAAIEGFYLFYKPGWESKPAGSLTIETSDSANSILKIPIGIEQSGLLDLEPQGWLDAATYLIVRPNPVVFESLPPGDREVMYLSVCPSPFSGDPGDDPNENPIRLTRLAVVGKDYYLMRFFNSAGEFVQLPIDGQYELIDEHQIQMAYEPMLDESQNGHIELEFLDRRGISQTFRVPILVK